MTNTLIEVLAGSTTKVVPTGSVVTYWRPAAGPFRAEPGVIHFPVWERKCLPKGRN